MAPPKSNGRKLPITELARPFFLKQFAMQEAQREQAEKDGKPYYDNDLVVAKPDGSPISASWVSSQFGKLLEDLDMPHIRFHDLRHTAATNMHQLTGDFYTVGEVLGHTLAGIGVSLGLSMNFEAVTARYVDVRLERKKEVLDAYHGAVKQADPAKAEKAEPKKAKSAAKKKEQRFRALTAVSLYRFLYRFIAPRGIRAPFGHHLPKSTTNTGDKRNAENTQKHSVYAGFRRFLIPQPT